MLRRLIRKEILAHVLSLRFSVAFVLFFGLIFASFYVTLNQYELDVERHDAIRKASMDRLREIAKDDEGWRRREKLLRWEGKLDPVGVPPLSAVVQGLQPTMPVAVNSRVDRWENIDQGYTRNPLLGLVRIPDFCYVVNVALSLLAILFAFDAVCGEKESGTLRLMLANAVPRHSVLLAKWIGGYLVLMLPFVLAVLGGVAYLRVQSKLELTGDHWISLALLLGVAALYISVFFTLSLFISTATHRSTTALFVCLFVWVAWILVVPNLAPTVARILSPAPSIKKIHAEKRAVDQEIRLRIQSLTQVSGELSYGESVSKAREELDREGQERKQQWDRFFQTAVKRQTRLAETLGRISPSGSWTYGAVALTGTGPAVYGKFEDGRKRMSEALKTFGDTLRSDKRDEWPELNVADVPRLDAGWADLQLNAAVTRALNDVLILIILNVVFFMASFMLFLRYDVR